MDNKEKKVYHIIMVVLAIFLGFSFCSADNTIKKCDEKIANMQDSYQMGQDLENFILDVVYETDIFNDISPEEQQYLDELEEQSYGRYCIQLIILYQKYYGEIINSKEIL